MAEVEVTGCKAFITQGVGTVMTFHAAVYAGNQMGCCDSASRVQRRLKQQFLNLIADVAFTASVCNEFVLEMQYAGAEIALVFAMLGTPAPLQYAIAGAPGGTMAQSL